MIFFIAAPSQVPLQIEMFQIFQIKYIICDSNGLNVGFDFIWTGSVTGIEIDKGWWCVCDLRWSSDRQRTVSSFTCVTCNSTNAVGELRYVGPLVMFLLLNCKQVTHTHLQSCYLKKILSTGTYLFHHVAWFYLSRGAQPPPFIEDMVGRTYTFQVRVSSYNFTACQPLYIHCLSHSERRWRSATTKLCCQCESHLIFHFVSLRTMQIMIWASVLTGWQDDDWESETICLGKT